MNLPADLTIRYTYEASPSEVLKMYEIMWMEYIAVNTVDLSVWFFSILHRFGLVFWFPIPKRNWRKCKRNYSGRYMGTKTQRYILQQIEFITLKIPPKFSELLNFMFSIPKC